MNITRNQNPAFGAVFIKLQGNKLNSELGMTKIAIANACDNLSGFHDLTVNYSKGDKTVFIYSENGQNGSESKFIEALKIIKKTFQNAISMFDVTQHEDVAEPTKDHLMWLMNIEDKK